MTIEPAPPPISRDWTLWVSENMLRDCSPASMLETMIGAGVNEKIALRCIQMVTASPIMQAARRHQQLTEKLESVMLNQSKLQQFDPKYKIIDRRNNLSTQELFENYFLANRPVIVTDMSDHWPGLKQWSPSYLKQKFGHVEVEVQQGRTSDRNYEQNKLQHRQRMALGAFVDRIESAGPSNDFYLTANNEALKTGPLQQLFDDIGPIPPYLSPETLKPGTFLWMGPAGTVTPLHHDTVHLFHLQVVGRKRWRFISPLQTPLVYNYTGVFSQVDLEAPDLGRHPLFEQATIIDVVVQPGEAIFLPLAWWHHVRAMDTCISLSFSNLRLPGEFEFRNPSNSHW